MTAAKISNITTNTWAEAYLRNGWLLVPIHQGGKGPRKKGWNLRENCISDPTKTTKLLRGIGLAHAYSGTCCLDVDDLLLARGWLEEQGVDLGAILDAPDAVLILSGRENRSKALFRLPDGVDQLMTVAKKESGIELRCASRNGSTVQDVLPPTIHPDTNVPYRWAGAGDWRRPPVLPEKLLALWQRLAEKQNPVGGPTGAPEQDPNDDPVVRHLDENGWVLAKSGLIKSFIRCPFEAGHTGSKTGVGDTVYFPAGTNGFAKGHFKCLHAHCADKKDSDFLEGVGYDTSELIAANFDEIQEDTEEPTPKLQVGKNGVLKTLTNITACLSFPQWCGVLIAKDAFKDKVLLTHLDTGETRELRNTDVYEIRLRLEKTARILYVGADALSDAIQHKAERNIFDSGKDWLNGKVWDKVPRIDTFFPTYLMTEDTPYTRAVGAYVWTAHAGRVIEPGVKADMVPILVGKQGVGKSEAIMAIAPNPEEDYREIDLLDDDVVLVRKIRGAYVIEFAELKGWHRDRDTIKAFITRRFENWTPKFKEFNQTYARRCLFWGSTNQEEFLEDETGNRRWLPLSVGAIDIDAIRRDRDQLWAEGAERFRRGGIAWRDVEGLARHAHTKHFAADPWEEIASEWVNAEGSFMEKTDGVRGVVGFTTARFMTDALKLATKDQNLSHSRRAAKVLRVVGCELKVSRVKGKLKKMWFFAFPPRRVT